MTAYIRNETNAIQVSGQMWIMECYQMRKHAQVLYNITSKH